MGVPGEQERHGVQQRADPRRVVQRRDLHRALRMRVVPGPDGVGEPLRGPGLHVLDRAAVLRLGHRRAAAARRCAGTGRPARAGTGRGRVRGRRPRGRDVRQRGLRRIGGVLGVADARDHHTRHDGHVVVQHHRAALPGHRRLGTARVVVAAHEHVGNAERADPAQGGRLHRRPPRGDVPGVDHRVHVELLHQPLGQVEAERVEVDVRDVQQGHQVAGTLPGQDRQAAAGGVQGGDRPHDVGQPAAVGLQAVQQAAGLTRDVRRLREQAGEPGLRQPVGVEGQRGHRRGGHEHAGNRGRDLRRPPPDAPVDQQRQGHPAEQPAQAGGDRGTHRRGAQPVRRGVGEVPQPRRGVDQLAGGIEVDLADPGLDGDRRQVGLEPHLAGRRQEHLDGGVQAGHHPHLGLDRPDDGGRGRGQGHPDPRADGGHRRHAEHRRRPGSDPSPQVSEPFRHPVPPAGARRRRRCVAEHRLIVPCPIRGRRAGSASRRNGRSQRLQMGPGATAARRPVRPRRTSPVGPNTTPAGHVPTHTSSNRNPPSGPPSQPPSEPLVPPLVRTFLLRTV